ncbi:MAG: trigger factor [Erysipelotrichales bacterium]|nr:trigger factor [Erysipelotrichales bacterium]
MKNVKEITVEVKGKDWESAIDKAFNKKKKDIKIDGFRKGSVTKEIFIKKVGIESLFMDAADIVIDAEYQKVIKDEKMEIVCEPNVSIEKIDKDGITIKFTLIGRPDVKLGKYKKLGVKKDKIEVKPEEIEHEIHHIMEHMAEIVVKEDGKVENGNTAVIDFEGVVDGKKLDGGTGANYPLEIGSKTFIPGFEEGVIGMKVGEKKVLKLKFPEDYTPELKGKDVEFTVTVREIKERVEPEMDKDFFEDLGIEGVDSKEKLETHVKHEIEHQKEHQVEDKYIDELLRKATDNMEVDINNEIIESEIDRMARQFEQELKMQGASLEQYLALVGTKMEDFRTTLKPQAIARLKTRYLLEEIIKVEKITSTKDEIKAKIKEESEHYGMSEEEFVNAIGGEEMIKYDVEMNKAIDILKEN